MNDTQYIEEPTEAEVDDWLREGERLGEDERNARSVMWRIGDWWNRGSVFVARAQRISAADWKGPQYQTCKVAGQVARRFPGEDWRQYPLEFEHFRLMAIKGIHDDKIARQLIAWCLETDPHRSARQLNSRIKQLRRARKEAELAQRNEDMETYLGRRRYTVVYADPPWEFQPWSEETGMDRSAANHYPTMALDAIMDIALPIAEDAVLFLWATVPMLPEALQVIDAWGFTYRSHFVWMKDKAGTGYWNRNTHELLLIGTRGEIPAPAPGQQFDSVQGGDVGEHSEKPAAFAEIIEEMFPNQRPLELFARVRREGWDQWGNELMMEGAEAP